MNFKYLALITCIVINSYANSSEIDGAFGLKFGDTYKVIPEFREGNNSSMFYPKNKLPGMTDDRTYYSVSYSPLSKRIWQIHVGGESENCEVKYDLERIFEKKYGKPTRDTAEETRYKVGGNAVWMKCEYFSWANSARFDLIYTSYKYYDITEMK